MADSIRLNQQMSSAQASPEVAAAVWDEMSDARGEYRPHWHGLSQKIHRWSAEERNSISASANRMIEDLGTTFNVYSDVGGAGQPYELDPIPLMVSPADWTQVSAGLAQRIRLIDAVLADVYGPQQLLKQGLLPPDLVHSSPAFLQYSRGVQPIGGRFVVTTGCDLVRTPNGQWTVLRDHTAAPGGLGQVLENRNVTSNLLSDQFESLRIARLGAFFDLERATLESLLPARGEMSSVVFLTPGFRHPSYFEHAYKARLLGFPLVEPADLTVRERRLFLKTLAGLRRIDVVASRINDETLDPLEHWGLGGGGVPGMVEAWRTGNVAMANAPGAGFASTPALMPFLPGICRKWFGEEIKLPFVETWWLSQPDIRRKVIDQLHRYVLLSAFNRDRLLPIRCASLSPAARKQWIATIEERPYDFVAQLDVAPSVAPSLEPRGIRQRPVVWRAFTVNAPGGPVALPGGLAKVGKTAQAPQMWPGHAGFTKDVWISDEAVGVTLKSEVKITTAAKGHHPSALEVPSRIAEQLFWVGRYSERIELATRLLRVTLRNLTGEAGRLQQQQLAACLTLIRGCNLLPKDVIIHPTVTLKTLAGLIHDESARGGIPSLTRSLLLNAAAARDRLSDDTWRFFNRLENVIHAPPGSPGTSDLLRTLDSLILHLSAIAGMQAENMTRGQGWRFLEVGRRVERSLGAVSLLRTAAGQGAGESAVLDPLLETCDSVMTYRRRHFSRPRLDAVIDLIFFDATNPRSVAYQIGILDREITRFPGDPEFGLLPKIREHLQGLDDRFLNPSAPDAVELEGLFSRLEVFADMLTQHYFSHSVRRVY
ncbi:MAG: circularly permuted type 2 ATP-grasp protein [Verrucomicrobiota bacterium]